MKTLLLSDRHFRVVVDPLNGSLISLSHPADPHRMNWVISQEESPRFMRSKQWGLGFSPLGRWDRAVSVSVTAHGCTSRYAVPKAAARVERRLSDGFLRERFTVTNRLDKPITMGGDSWAGLGIYAPFNDNYPDSSTCIRRRCNAHLWCGGELSYVCCLRMGGEAPHLGLVLTEGSLHAYGIEDRDAWASSNSRGTIVLYPSCVTLAPGASWSLAWTLFWHNGWDDFFATARGIPGFAHVRADQLTCEQGASVTVFIDSARSNPAVRASLDGKRLPRGDRTHPGVVSIEPRDPGPHRLDLVIDGKSTHASVFVTPAVLELARARARFIVDHQQVTDAADPLFGAYLVYDTETGALVHHHLNGGNHNEGQERVGTGCFLARYLRIEKDRRIDESLSHYYRFVRDKLQDRRGHVRPAVGQAPHRLYNYPWVAQFHLEMHRLTGSSDCLVRLCKTLDAYYARDGHRFYAIGIPMLDGVRALERAGMTGERSRLLGQVVRHAERIMANGLEYPRHEVNYEQSIVAPAAIMLLEAHLLTGRAELLDEARRHLRALEMFSGRQPDHRLHEIAIRHWDGFWFGKHKCWGDTFPHYWSTLTAVAFHRYWEITGDCSYRDRSRAILMNNLCSFFPDGRASCAHIYPHLVNGQAGAFSDPLANDQDWALFYALPLMEEMADA